MTCPGNSSTALVVVTSTTNHGSLPEDVTPPRSPRQWTAVRPHPLKSTHAFETICNKQPDEGTWRASKPLNLMVTPTDR